MPFPKIIYDPGAGEVTLPFTRGPVNFSCSWKSRLHDNLASSGLRERVVEAHDLLIAFTMPALRINDDLPAWSAFAKFALDGTLFDFYPNSAFPDYYHCVSDDDAFDLSRLAPGVYSAAFRFRILPDAQAPAGPEVILQRFYGISS